MIEYIYDDGGRKAAGYKGDTGDCAVRAIAIAADADYQHVYKAMCDAMQEHGYVASGNAYRQKRKDGGKRKRGQLNGKQVQQEVMAQFGFRKVTLGAGERPTYTEAHARYGNCIVSTTRHVCALKGGALRDTFDGRTYDWIGSHPDTGNFNEKRERKAMSVWVRD